MFPTQRSASAPNQLTECKGWTTSVAWVAQQALVVVDVVGGAVVEVERAADFDFGAGTFSNFIFSDWQSLEEFGRLQMQCRAEAAPATTRDPLLRIPYWGIHRLQSRESHGLCLTTDSRQLREKREDISCEDEVWHEAELTCVGEVVLLQPHLTTRYHIRDNVFLIRVLVDAIGPLVDRHNLTPFLVNCTISRLIIATNRRKLLLVDI